MQSNIVCTNFYDEHNFRAYLALCEISPVELKATIPELKSRRRTYSLITMLSIRSLNL